MKANSDDIRIQSNDAEQLRAQIKYEKEALVSMFLANAPSDEMTEQFERIDQLNRQITGSKI